MKKIPFFLVFFALTASCQDFGKLEIISDLPKLVDEVSGIAKFESQDLLWMVNDSGNPPEIYGFNLKEQKITQTAYAKNGKNIDWEDLATHPDGTLYVGDFGNNNSDRKDLTIYHIKESSSKNKGKTEAAVTTFKFEDQEKFPPKRKDISFDVEALIYLNDHFYVFTRNRAKKYDGKTRIYKIPAKPGDFIAKYMGSIKTCKDQSDCEITSADIHHPTGKIALLSYDKVWIIDNYKGDDFSSGNIDKIKLGYDSQKEGICFKSENELYIADEKTKGKGRNLYLLKLK